MSDENVQVEEHLISRDEWHDRRLFMDGIDAVLLDAVVAGHVRQDSVTQLYASLVSSPSEMVEALHFILVGMNGALAKAVCDVSKLDDRLETIAIFLQEDTGAI